MNDASDLSGCVRLAASQETRRQFWRTVDLFRSTGLFCDVVLYPHAYADNDPETDKGVEMQEGVHCHAIVLAALSHTLAEAMAHFPLDEKLSLFLPGVERAHVLRFVEAAYGYLSGREDASPFELEGELAQVSQALFVDSVRLESAPVNIKTEVEPPAYPNQGDGGSDNDDGDPDYYVGWQEEVEDSGEEDEETSEEEEDEEEEDGDYAAPRPKKRKQKRGSKGKTKPKIESPVKSEGVRRRGRPRKNAGPEDEETVKKELPPLPPADDIYAQMVSGHGCLQIEMSKAPLDNKKLDKALSARKIKYMALVGLKRLQGETQSVSMEGLPLAWTPLEEIQTEGDRFSQYSNYCKALKCVLGLSEIEAHYQPYVMTSMGLNDVVNPGASTRVFAKRRHCDKSEAELKAQLEKEDPEGLSRPGAAKPTLEWDSEFVQLNLSLAPAVEELEGVALLTFEVSGKAEGACLGFGKDGDRAKEAHYFLKTLCDVWSLRRPDGMVEKSENIAKVFTELRLRAEVCNVLHAFLSSGAKEAYASTFQSDRQCPSCGRVFEIRNEKEYRRYQYHCKTHYYKDHPCDCPGLKFETARAKMAHVQLVHKTGFSKCPLCPHVSKTQFLVRHMEAVHGSNNDCPHCSRVVEGAQNLFEHVRLEHSEEVRQAERAVDLDARKVFGGRKPYKRGPRPEVPSACDQCGKVYKNCSSLYKHMYSHNRFVCKMCGFNTTVLVKYREHMRLDHHKPLHWQPNARRYLW